MRETLLTDNTFQTSVQCILFNVQIRQFISQLDIYIFSPLQFQTPFRPLYSSSSDKKHAKNFQPLRPNDKRNKLQKIALPNPLTWILGLMKLSKSDAFLGIPRRFQSDTKSENSSKSTSSKFPELRLKCAKNVFKMDQAFPLLEF